MCIISEKTSSIQSFQEDTKPVCAFIFRGVKFKQQIYKQNYQHESLFMLPYAHFLFSHLLHTLYFRLLQYSL